MIKVMNETLEVLEEGDKDPWEGETRSASELLQAQDQMSEQRWVETLERARGLAERCVHCCVVSRGVKRPDHRTGKCPKVNWGALSSWKSSITFQEYAACFACGFPQDICKTAVDGCDKCRKDTGQKCEDPQNCPGPCKFQKMLWVACHAALHVRAVEGIYDHVEAGCRHAIKTGGKLAGSSLGRCATIGLHNVSVLFTIFEKLLDKIEVEWES
jgi:hypothetical protein